LHAILTAGSNRQKLFLAPLMLCLLSSFYTSNPPYRQRICRARGALHDKSYFQVQPCPHADSRVISAPVSPITKCQGHHCVPSSIPADEVFTTPVVVRDCRPIDMVLLVRGPRSIPVTKTVSRFTLAPALCLRRKIDAVVTSAAAIWVSHTFPLQLRILKSPFGDRQL
jgi:hypothetical protein